MRVQVNLATRPFVELRPFFLRLRLIMGALALTGLLIALGSHLLSVKAARQQAQLDALRNQTIAAQSAKLRTEQRMRQPGNAQVLDRAHFLNALFLRKSFSWTAVMMDLENVLPPGVQVTTIEPGVSADGAVTIRLRVAGQRDRAVQLVRNLERSRRFLDPRLGSETSQSREQAALNGGRAGAAPGSAPGAPGTPAAAIPGALPGPPPGVEFEILANYNPLPADEPYGAAHRTANISSAVSSRSVKRPSVPAAVHSRPGFPRDGVVLPPSAGSTQTAPRMQPGGPQ